VRSSAQVQSSRQTLSRNVDPDNLSSYLTGTFVNAARPEMQIRVNPHYA
jgi:hypothetical protein